jgi:hypothetical protein
MINVNSLDNRTKSALLIRHAHRDKIPDGVIGMSEPINKIGEANAIRLGESLSHFDSLTIKTSPVNRCIQTGEAIATGFRKPIQMSSSHVLGDPGVFISDEVLASESFRQWDCITVVEKQIDNQHLCGIRSLEEGSHLLKDYIVEEMGKSNDIKDLLIFITHDAILAPFIYYYTGERFHQLHWIDFIDGIIISHINTNFSLIRNGIKYDLH